jgi:cytochrome c553
MKRFWIYGLVLALVVALSWAAGGKQAQASNKIAKLEGLQCTVCHDKPGSKLLTDRGKYYEEMHSLAGYDDVVAAFAKCTSCHENKPGSKLLTERGQRYAWVVNDMEGLRQWLRENHPPLKSGEQPERPQR